MNVNGSSSSLEIWGGVECTLNRVGDVYFDQLEKNGHAGRLSDLDLFASLGIKTIRYPVLWERFVRERGAPLNWSWADERLSKLRELGMSPIIGLVHHGSGPRWTNLLDPQFPRNLAEFARSFAERYPWVESYTPVNEPLTTARFSCLYGLWYPHQRAAQPFVRALLTQCRAIAAAMHAIRQVNPRAKLVQTEDLGTVLSTPRLRYQAHFENCRRWLTWDLLCGKLDHRHPMWKYFRSIGIKSSELTPFLEEPCRPDIIGINHYVTSDRYLDDRLPLYPPRLHGGNDRDRYVDVEAVRACEDAATGPRAPIREAWDRYRIPIAITEAHLGCGREEQIRWLKEIWVTAGELASEGIDLRAVTAWSLLGTFDWDSLVTRDAHHYEPGVFDVSGGKPRSTVLARMVSSLASTGDFDHALMDSPGWWRRAGRFAFVPSRACESWIPVKSDRRCLLITGATGTLGQAFARVCGTRGISYRLLSRSQMDIADPESVARVIEDCSPWAIINAAGYVRVDEAESDPAACFRENVLGVVTLASACSQKGIGLVTFSSDLVFGGAVSSPYTESSSVSPLSVYGRSKAEAESKTLEICPEAIVIRTSAFFGPWDELNFVTVALRRLAQGEQVIAADDTIVSPTYLPDLVDGTLNLLIDGERGIWHLANSGEVSWAELARAAAKGAGVNALRIEGRPFHDLNLKAVRPRYSALGTERGLQLPHYAYALERYLKEKVA